MYAECGFLPWCLAVFISTPTSAFSLHSSYILCTPSCNHAVCLSIQSISFFCLTDDEPGLPRESKSPGLNPDAEISNLPESLGVWSERVYCKNFFFFTAWDLCCDQDVAVATWDGKWPIHAQTQKYVRLKTRPHHRHRHQHQNSKKADMAGYA